MDKTRGLYKIFILSFILLSSFLNYACKEQKSTLTIKNFPFNGTSVSDRKIIVIYDYSNLPEQNNSNTTEQSELNNNKKSFSELTQEEIEELKNLMINALRNSNSLNEPQPIRVAKCYYAFNSPFKLISFDNESDWVGNGIYTVYITVNNDLVRSIEKKDVVFKNGSATIDYNDMDIKYKN